MVLNQWNRHIGEVMRDKMEDVFTQKEVHCPFNNLRLCDPYCVYCCRADSINYKGVSTDNQDIYYCGVGNHSSWMVISDKEEVMVRG